MVSYDFKVLRSGSMLSSTVHDIHCERQFIFYPTGGGGGGGAKSDGGDGDATKEMRFSFRSFLHLHNVIHLLVESILHQKKVFVTTNQQNK